MNNKVKQVLVLLFVVSTLLLMVGSVSANTDNLNENLEASDTLNVDLSAIPDADLSADEDVSNQLTISNIDEKTNDSSQVMGESNSNVVSNYEDTTIDAKDSDNVIKADNNANEVLSEPIMVITNTVLNPVVNVGDEVTFNITVVNNGDSYQGLQDGDVYFVPMQIDYDSTQLEYLRFSPQSNPENYLPVRDNYNNVQFAYNTYGDFRQGSSFEFTVTFRTKTAGTLRTSASVLFTNARAEAQVNAMNFAITNTVLNPVVNIGDEVKFEVVVKNNGPSFYYDGFVGVNFYFNSNELEYVGYTPEINPDGNDFRGYFLSPKEEGKNYGFTQYAFQFSQWGGFHNGYCFKFTVTLKAKVHGTLGAAAQITQLNSVSAWTTTTSMDPFFNIKNTALNPFVNIDDTVSFEIFGRNVGSSFKGDVLGIVIEYNDTAWDYVGIAPGINPDVPWMDFSGNYNNYPPDDRDGRVLVGYDCRGSNFENNHCFNFTITFKVKAHGIFQTTAYILQYPWPFSTAQVISNDTNFVMTETPSSLTMRVGDDVSFNYLVQNQGTKFDGNYLSLDVYFDAGKLQYKDFSRIPNLNFESLEYTSTLGSDNVLGATDGYMFGVDSSVGHLKLGYTSSNGFDAGSAFNFDVQFQALTDGKLQSSAIVGWDQSKYSTMVSAYTFAGDPSFKLTKTADNQFVNKGDYVSYEVFLVNNGTLQYIEKDMVIYINDWYPEGLDYVGNTVNPDKNGFKPQLEIDYSQDGHVQIKYDLSKNGMTEGWAPGSTLNITLHFQVVSDGILCNFVFSEWNSSDVSSVVSGEPEINLTKKCLNSTVEVGDLVYYEIYLENTGDITYYDHSQGGTDYLIIEDLYPEGLEYVDYIPNPDKNGDRWDENYASVDDDKVNHRVVVKYKIWNQRWQPGDSLNVTLIFKAVNVGKLTNKAKFYWLWDDTITGSGNEINLTDETDVVVGPPAFSIEKISNYKEAKVGDIVSFSIVYSNTGNRTITGAYITDNVYSQGLKYYDFEEKELWTFDGKDTWYYNNKLEPGESVTLTLLFKALTVGKKSNTARAGHNMNNDTLEDTDTVLIKEGVNGTANTVGLGVSPDESMDESMDEPDESMDKQDRPIDKPNKDVNEEPKGESDTYKESVAAESTMHEAGNPLFVLLLSLLTLCFVQRKGKE